MFLESAAEGLATLLLATYLTNEAQLLYLPQPQLHLILLTILGLDVAQELQVFTRPAELCSPN